MVAWSSVPERPLCLKEPRSVQKHQLKAEDTKEKDSWLWKEYVLHGSLQTLPENGALVTVTVCRMLHGRTDSKSCFSWYAKLLSANVENILCVAKNGSQSFCWIYRLCPPVTCAGAGAGRDMHRSRRAKSSCACICNHFATASISGCISKWVWYSFLYCKLSNHHRQFFGHSFMGSNEN